MAVDLMVIIAERLQKLFPGLHLRKIIVGCKAEVYFVFTLSVVPLPRSFLVRIPRGQEE